jgi:AraC family transcriptional regulator of adaptative response/methylated-DNA-[protein]-cysteine methyltransferase
MQIEWNHQTPIVGAQPKMPQLLDDREILTDDKKWRAVISRNIDLDDVFVFAVGSTGIYCKPSCPARRPSRDQVVFFRSPDEAERSGYRPCRRCRPREGSRSPHAELIDRVCDYVNNNLSRKLILSTLSAYVGISPFHLQRIFKHALGISPRQYVEARRLIKMKHLLRNGETVTKALYGAGFSSRSRLYEKVPHQFGVSPGALRRGGLGLRIDYTIVDCPLGRLLVGATKRGICAVCMGATDSAVKAALSEEYPSADLRRNDEGMHKWIKAFMDYSAGQPLSPNLPLDVQATSFQWRVWKEIQSIPHGNTTTYSKIANAIGEPHAPRAVARACATNPVSLVIPCHRVIGEDDELHGYRWGKRRKEALLLLEQKTRHED